MQFLNKIELRGIVGMSTVTRIGDKQLCRFSLVTEYAHKTPDGKQAVDVTWFNIVAFDSKTMPDFKQIQRGTVVRVRGRVRAFHATTDDGTERNC